MTPEMVVTIGRHALEVTLMLSAPLLLTALAVGLIVGIFQAATQIQDQTLAFVPKLIVVLVVLIAMGPVLGSALVRFTQALFAAIPSLG